MTDFQIIDLVVGTGKAAERGSLITAHYTGTLTDGIEFDSSHRRGQVFECVIGTGRVIKGWDLGVLGDEIGVKLLQKWGMELELPKFSPMQIGGKRRLIVPAFLAYGERAVGKILPNSDLIFEIELIDVKTRDE